MRINLKPLFTGVGLVLLSACATTPFVPMESHQTRLPEGQQAAVYSISSGRGDWDNVVVHIWTSGPRWESKPKTNKKAQSFIDVVWRVNNQSKDEVQLNLAAARLSLKSYTTEPQTSSSTLTVPVGSESTARLSFPLPDKTDTELLRAFDVNWSLSGAGQKYSQTTRFERPQSSGRVQPSLGIGLGIGL